jgi:hypothetical protein
VQCRIRSVGRFLPADLAGLDEKPRSPRRWSTRTRWVWGIATSSQPTSCWIRRRRERPPESCARWGNFTLFIDKEALAKFKKAKIEDTAAQFQGKTVQVTGKVTLYRERPEIKLTGPDVIKVVEKK